MNVTLLGATGQSGSAILRELLDRGHAVTVLARPKADRPPFPPGVRVVSGNALSVNDLREAVRGQDAVVHALGLSGKGGGEPTTFFSDSAARLIDALRAEGVTRLLVLSNFGVGDGKAAWPWVFRKFILPLGMPWLKAIMDDKERMEPRIRESGLDWTIVRAPAIVRSPARGRTRHSATGRGLGRRITAPDLAAWVVDDLETGCFLHQSPSVSN